ncbi:GNAT family N-acetyltransferase [Candidatus Aenigmatarchaeota archaeon]
MYKIIELEETDIHRIKNLLNICWIETYTGILSDGIMKKFASKWLRMNTIMRSLQNKETFFAGCKYSNRLVGAITAELSRDIIHVHRLYILPSYQKKGIGSKLLKAAINHFKSAKALELEVLEVNNNAIEFYKKKGFVVSKKKEIKIGDEKLKSFVLELVL